MNTLFNNQSYIDETDNVFVGWDAIKGKEPLSVYHEMTFLLCNKIGVTNGLTNLITKEHFMKIFIKVY